MSKSSTSTCVLSLIHSAKWEAGPWKDTAGETLRIFLTDKWVSAGLEVNNPFTVAFVLEAAQALIPYVKAPLTRTLRARCNRAVAILKREIDTGFVSLQGYPPSAYLTQLVTRVLVARNLIEDATRAGILVWAWQELNNQLALL